jgi:amino acid transporter
MATQDEIVQEGALAGDIDVDKANVDKLHKNAIGLPGVLYFCLAGSAPISAMLFNVPSMASQAGATTPLVFLLSGIGLLLLGVSIVYLSRRLTSAGGFYTWVRHSLGKGTAFQAGWLMMGGYALFEASLLGAFGSYTNSSIATYLHFNLAGGWVSYALIGAVLIFLLSYFDVKWSVYAMAPFLLLEVGVLVILDIAITVQGGHGGTSHDLVHTFTAAGADLKGAAPGGVLGIGVAMALGVWSWIGFEAGAVYGEEARNPRRAVPVAIFAVVAFLTLLYTWTSYSATIGYGWTHAVDQFGNLTANPTPYYPLANNYVGGWLQALMIVAISTSALACGLAFHNGMVRYLYAMGREGILGRIFGKTHSRYHSPYIAIIAQLIFTALLIIAFAFVIQKSNANGSTSYALGIADGKTYTQTDGIYPYTWLAIMGTIAFVVVYIMVNISAPVYAWRFDKKGFNVLAHIVAPVLSTLVLLIPLISFIMPAIPGAIGSFFTGLGFASTPFPLNILPLFVVGWVIIGLIYANYLARSAPERYEGMGRIVRGDV